MSTPLLTQSPGTGCPVAEPYRIRARLLARLWAWKLDQVLASGACPDANAVLSLRARRLIGIATRRALACELREVIRVAHDPRRQLHLGVRICVGEVLRVSDALEDLADRLASWDPVESAGVARARLLVRDGGGPLYNELLADRLERSVYAAIDALEPNW